MKKNHEFVKLLANINSYWSYLKEYEFNFTYFRFLKWFGYSKDIRKNEKKKKRVFSRIVKINKRTYHIDKVPSSEVYYWDEQWDLSLKLI